MVIASFLGLILLGYLAGSIPTAVWVGKYGYGMDIRDHGSGNAGATNMFRVLGWKPALGVVIVDIAKGLLPTLFFWRLSPFVNLAEPVYLQLLTGCAAVAGHVWTLFAGFRGGKGVATAAGMLFALYPQVAPICIAVFFGTIYLTRMVSLASMLATTSLPLALLGFHFGGGFTLSWPLLWFSLTLCIFILFTHRANIVRIIQGREHRFGRSKQTKEPPAKTE